MAISIKVDDYIDTLLNDRLNFYGKLYTHDELNNILTNIELGNFNKNKYKNIYKRGTILKNLFLGKSKLNKNMDKITSFYVIPTVEIINIIINLINKFDIKFIEEINAGCGLLSKLIKLNITNPIIWASDNFSSNSTSNCGIYSINNKNISDIKTYKQLNESNPNMIISAFPVINDNKINNNIKIITDIFDLINNNNHKIILLFLSLNHINDFNRCLTYINNNSNYYVFTRYVKGFCYDDNPTLNILHDIYPKSFGMVTLIRKNISNSVDLFKNCFENEIEFNKIIGNENIFDKKLILTNDFTYDFVKLVNSYSKNHNMLEHFIDINALNYNLHSKINKNLINFHD